MIGDWDKYNYNRTEWNKMPNDPQWQMMGIKPLKDKWESAPYAVSEECKVAFSLNSAQLWHSAHLK